MKHISDPINEAAILNRLAALRADSPRLWGKMTPAEMLLHCRKQIGLGTGEVSSRPLVPKPIQWLVKQTVGFRLPWKTNLPTAREMIAHGETGLDFATEREALKAVIRAFNALPDDAQLTGHPIFGPMNKDEWGRIIYKHLDHHLRQFGK